MNNEKVITIASKLYECRNTAKQLLGERFGERMSEYQQLIKSQANASQCEHLEAAKLLIKGGGSMRTIMILSAYVEMVEPS